MAISGGADSVCLLHLLHTNAKALDITVKAINIEHGIRGESSLQDSLFVKNFCVSLGIELKSYAVNAPAYAKENGYSLEQSARILRYECFDNALIEGFCDKIATAHHLSDNVETVLFNLFRGSALAGVCGIDEVNLNGKIVRPLLSCSRAQIDEYVKQNNLPFVYDESNDCNDYTRNFLRNEVLPLIESRFEGAQGRINSFSSLAARDERLLNSLAEKLLDGFSVEFVDELYLPLFTRACLKVMKRLGITKDFESVHLDAVYNLKKLQTGKSVDLKNGVKAYKSKNRAVFERAITPTEWQFDFELNKPFESEKYEFRFEKADKLSPKFLCFDGDKLPYNASIRTKRTGDKIVTFGGQTKTLKKFFNDKKIDARVSSFIPVIAVGSEIYAVLTVDVSKKIAVDKNTVNIIKIICKGKGE